MELFVTNPNDLDESKLPLCSNNYMCVYMFQPCSQASISGWISKNWLDIINTKLIKNIKDVNEFCF